MDNEKNIDESEILEPADATGGGPVAESYVSHELTKARSGLTRTRVGSMILLLLVGGEMLYLTGHTMDSLRPVNASEITTGLISERIQEREPEITDYIKEQVPLLIKQAPDYALAALPRYRKQIEARVDDDLKSYAESNINGLGAHLDKFLEANKDQVNAMMDAGQDQNATNAMGVRLKAEFESFLAETPPGGESIKTKLNETFKVLQQVEDRSKRLAYAKDLDPSEKKARRALAIMLTTISHTQKSMSPDSPTAQALSSLHGDVSTQVPAQPTAAAK